jgi:hypothetical protein
MMTSLPRSQTVRRGAIIGLGYVGCWLELFGLVPAADVTKAARYPPCRPELDPDVATVDVASVVNAGRPLGDYDRLGEVDAI